IIPFFGPFIGAIPSALLILLVSPRQCLYFLGFILLLQQFDGNILGPKILGDSTGLSSFWVLFSILLFGGLMGPIGMIIGVPTFAVLYKLLSERVSASLKKKQLSTDTSDYCGLDHIDENKKTYLK
ncbi:MAG: AI-2E family transporter, partial [Hungatella sp.]